MSWQVVLTDDNWTSYKYINTPELSSWPIKFVTGSTIFIVSLKTCLGATWRQVNNYRGGGESRPFGAVVNTLWKNAKYGWGRFYIYQLNNNVLTLNLFLMIFRGKNENNTSTLYKFDPLWKNCLIFTPPDLQRLNIIKHYFCISRRYVA